MAYVHRNCLNEWRRQSIHPNSIYQCDTCKFNYRFATAIGPDRFTIARVLAWPISIHLLSVMGLFCLCFAGGFVAKLFDASLTWSDFNLKSCFNIDHLLIGATAIVRTVYYAICYVLALCYVLWCIALIICAIFLLFLLLYECLYDWIHFLYECLYDWIRELTVRLSAREAAAGEAGATAAAQHVVLDVGAGHDHEEDGEANRGSFGGVEDTAHAQEHGNGNAPHPLERQPLIARP